MHRTLLKSKLHRVKVTQAELDYVGSITIDLDLMEAADIVEHERVDVLDITNGARLTTYAIQGERGSGEICINGAAARLVNPNDLVIILTYAQLTEEEVKSHKPIVVFVDDSNSITDRAHSVS